MKKQKSSRIYGIVGLASLGLAGIFTQSNLREEETVPVAKAPELETKPKPRRVVALESDDETNRFTVTTRVEMAGPAVAEQ